MAKNKELRFFRLFKGNSEFDKWPLGILLQMVFLKRRFLREFCCNCGRNLRFKRVDNMNGDSGEICPTCLRRECPRLYEEMKGQGKFTAEQINEAEKLSPD